MREGEGPKVQELKYHTTWAITMALTTDEPGYKRRWQYMKCGATRREMTAVADGDPEP